MALYDDGTVCPNMFWTELTQKSKKSLNVRKDEKNREITDSLQFDEFSEIFA